METGLIIAAVGLAIIFYLLPSIISEVRHAQHGTAIFMINFFLGWTVLGWFAALIWAIVEAPEESKKTEPIPTVERPAPIEQPRKYPGF